MKKLIFIYFICLAKAISGAQAVNFLNIRLHLPEDKISKIKVTPNTTVKALMSYVKNHSGITPDKQHLVAKSTYGGYALNNRFSHLKDYDIKDGDNIYVYTEPKPLNESLSDTDYILNFVQSDNTRYRLYVSPNATVGELKKLINKQPYMTYGIPVNLFKSWDIAPLNDNIKLKDADINDGNKIRVYPQKYLFQ